MQVSQCCILRSTMCRQCCDLSFKRQAGCPKEASHRLSLEAEMSRLLRHDWKQYQVTWRDTSEERNIHLQRCKNPNTRIIITIGFSVTKTGMFIVNTSSTGILSNSAELVLRAVIVIIIMCHIALRLSVFYYVPLCGYLRASFIFLCLRVPSWHVLFCFQPLSQNSKSDYELQYVRLPVRIEQLGSYWTDVDDILYLTFSEILSSNFQVPLKPDKSNCYFTWRSFHIYDNISLKCFRQKL